jgi:hypothetical protein
VRLKDGTVRFVPPLDPLTTKAISPRFLSGAERVEIADDTVQASHRMNANTIELDASHLSIVSRAKEVSDLILKATAM